MCLQCVQDFSLDMKCLLVHTSLYTHPYSVCFMCLDVHIEHKLVETKADVHVESGLMLSWQLVTQRFLVKINNVLVQVSHIVLGITFSYSHF